jgi:WD40 repeat protein
MVSAYGTLTIADVQDLNWSPDNKILVSVGLDSAIMVWNAQTFGIIIPSTC